MPIQIRRTATPDNPPVGLLPGQLSVEMASDPPRLWVGVPTSIDALGRREIGRGPTSTVTLLGGLLSYISPTELRFSGFRGLSEVKHNGHVWFLPPDGIAIPNTNVLVDGVVGNLSANRTYYVCLTTVPGPSGDELAPNFVPFTDASHMASTTPGNEGTEIIARGDPLWNQVRFLIGNDNAPDGTMTYLDQGPNNLTIGNAQTAAGFQPRYSTSGPPGMQTSILFPLTIGPWFQAGGRLEVPAGPHLALGTQDFCFECYFTNTNNWTTLVQAPGNVWRAEVQFAGAPWLYVRFPGLGVTNAAIGLRPLAQPPTWHHFALFRRGNQLFAALDGAVRNLATSPVAVSDLVQPFLLGHAVLNTDYGHAGNICSARLTVGHSRYVPRLIQPPQFGGATAADVGYILPPELPLSSSPLMPPDDNQTVIGLIRTTISAQFADDLRQRFVASWFNRSLKGLAGPHTDGATTSAANAIEINPEGRIEFVSWDATIPVGLTGSAWPVTVPGGAANGSAFAMIGIDGPNPVMPSTLQGTNTLQEGIPLGGFAVTPVPEGYHYFTPLGGVAGGMNWSMFRLAASALLFT